MRYGPNHQFISQQTSSPKATLPPTENVNLFATCTSPIIHLVYPPKFCITFALRYWSCSRRNWRQYLRKSLEANKVYYGSCANDELASSNVTSSWKGLGFFANAWLHRHLLSFKFLHFAFSCILFSIIPRESRRISSREKRACFPRASQGQRDFLLSSLVGVRLDVIQSSGVKVHHGFPGNRLPSMTSADSTDMFYSWRAEGVFSSENYNNVSLRKQPTLVVSPPNDVWETSAEIPYWWRVTTQIWVVLLIGLAASQIYFNHPASSVWNFCARFSDVIWWGNQW